MPRVQKTKTQLLEEIERLTARVRELESSLRENAVIQSSTPKSSDGFSPMNRPSEEESMAFRLRESEERYRKIAEGLPQIIWMTSPDSQELYYVSPSFERVLQRPLEDIYRDPQIWFKSVHPDDRLSTEKIFKRCRQGEPAESEYRIVRPSGEIRWIRDRAFPILNERGEFTRIAGIAEDITESKQAERERQALQRLSHRLTAPLTLEQLGEAVAQESRSLFHHDAFLLLIIDKKEGLARDIYAEDTYDGDRSPRKIHAPDVHPWDSRKYYAILRGKPVLLNRKRLPARSRFSPFGDTARLSRSLMFCPVRWENQTIGILSVQSYTAGRYRKSDLQLLGIFADHVGGAMARTLMENSLREAHDRLEESVEERTRELAIANRNLEESREQLQAVLDALPGCLMWVDSTRQILGVNRYLAELLGHPSETLIGKEVDAISCDPPPREVITRFFASPDEGRPLEVTFRRNGQARQFWAVGRKYRQGKQAVFVGIEITERKQMEKALRESEDKLAGIVDSITDHMSMMDEGHTIVWANGVAKRMFGPDLVGKKCYSAYHGKDRVCDHCIVSQTFSDGLAHEHQTEVIDQKGNSVHFWCTSNVAARRENGRPALVVEVSRDITEHRLAALALENSERKFRVLFEEATDGIFISSREGRILEANPALMKMFGISKDDLARHTAGDFYANVQDREKFRREVEAKGSVKDYEMRMKHRDGSVISCLTSAGLWRTPDGAVGGYQGVIRDVSRQKQIEEDKRRMEQMRRDFVANVSHEFKTPLTAIRGYAETLLDKNLEDRETALRFLGVILNQSIRLQRLTNNLLKLSQLDEGSLDIEFQAVDIPVLIGFCLETLRIKAEAKDLTIQSDIPASLPQVHGDAWWLRQVFQNIMDNAVEYSIPGGRITVWARDCGEEVEVTVSDTGIGIRKEMLPRIFERFYRGDASRSSRGGGTGLGLAIVKELVRVHNGRIQVDSQPGRGTSFSVFFPKVGRDLTEKPK